MISSKFIFKKNQQGFVDILIAFALLIFVLWTTYYLSESTANSVKYNKKRNMNLAKEAAIRHIYESIDCCKTLAPFQVAIDDAFIDDCSEINTHGAVYNAPSNPEHFTVIIKNTYDGNVLDNWTGYTPPGLFPGYGIAPFNIAIKCVDGGNTGAAKKGHAGGITRALRLFFYANINDPLTNRSLENPQQYSEVGRALCLCTDVFFSGYTAFCSGSSSSSPPAWGLRKCENL